jgi:hypothetical protein
VALQRRGEPFSSFGPNLNFNVNYSLQINMVLLEEEELTLEALGIEDDSQILLEVRNKDLTWPEEMGSLQQQQLDRRRQSMLGWFF